MRDVAVRPGRRIMIQQPSSGALKGALATIGTNVAQRMAGTAAGRWGPLAGAAAVGAYAYWDTLQGARTAPRLLEAPAPDSDAAPRAGRQAGAPTAYRLRCARNRTPT